ncbi:MAG: hydroxymethylpyrimidine pyrophosphatase-like HAD family hydrolase [Salibacteraceae bacterium]|jgi:hydroxymethylpyrimidine pyrophosphatase-like HAD family hydrolase
MFEKMLTIAVDFDGTIAEDAYPKIGKPMPFAFETLKMLEAKGHRLILWTVRSGKTLQEAVAYCKKHGIEFYAVNNEFAEEQFSGRGSRKVNADIFIDDRNIGGFVGWGTVYHLIEGEDAAPLQKASKKGLFSFLK